MADRFDEIRTALTLRGKGSSDFDLNSDLKLPADRKLRDAAVLVPIIERDDGLHLILTKRSSRLKHHPGQIAFPGGKVDGDDETLEDAAFREAFEEIGLSKANLAALGQLDSHETITGFSVCPVVAQVVSPFQVVPEPGEVAEVFEVPFDFVMDANNFSVQYRIWQGTKRYYYTVPYGPYYIWGATARILRGFAKRLAK